MKFLTTVLLLLSSLTVFGTTYSGRVTLACTTTPLEGVIVEITGTSGIGGFTYQTTTNEDGRYRFIVSGTESFWTIRVDSPQGNTSPASHYYLPSQGNISSANFELLIQPDFFYGDPDNGIVLNPNDSPNSVVFNPQEHCLNSSNCINMDYLPLVDYYWGTTNSVCFGATVYLINVIGNRRRELGDIKCFSLNGRPQIADSKECRAYSLDFDPLVQNSINQLVEVVITQGCCRRDGCPDKKGLVNQWSYYFRINGISNASIDFNFNVSLSVDQNNGGDPANDGVQPIALSPTGPALGKFSTAINATITSDEPLDQITYNLYEVDCNTGSDNGLILSNTVSLNGAEQPDNYSFVNFKDEEGNPYFLKDEHHLGKCFKIECVSENKCGEVTAYSYFTIDPAEFFTGNPNSFLIDGTNVGAVPVGFIAEKNQSIILVNRIYPNPVSNQLNVDLMSFSDEVTISIIDIKGQLISSHTLANGNNQIDVSTLPKGMYVVKSNFSEIKTMRFVKL